MLARHLILITPVCLALALLPADWGTRLGVLAFVLLSSTFVVTVNAGNIRQARLRQHGLPVPDDAERGHPPH